MNNLKRWQEVIEEDWKQAVLDTSKTPMNFQETAELFAKRILTDCERDAARYRHIRRADVDMPTKTMSYGNTTIIVFLHGEELDAAVDKDMEK